MFTDNAGLVYYFVRRYLYFAQMDRALDLDDIVQAGFIGLIEAEAGYDAGKGAFATWAAYFIKKEIRAACGLRGARKAHTCAVSLDAPFDAEEAGGDTRLDMLADDSIPSADSVAIDSDIAAILARAVDGLEDKAGYVVRRHLMDGAALGTAAQEVGLTHAQARALEARGLKALRRDKRVRELMIDSATDFYRHKGAHQFASDWTSTTEAIAIDRDRIASNIVANGCIFDS